MHQAGRKTARIELRRELLLIEIERRSSNGLCRARARIGLTKEEACLYRGFECERCGRRTKDALSQSDVPEWWEELSNSASLNHASEPVAQEGYEPSEVILRINNAYRHVAKRSSDDPGEDSR